MRTFLNSVFLFSGMVISPFAMQAAENVPAAKESYSFNPVLIGLVSLILVLVFAIALLANIIRQLTFVQREKMRADRNKSSQVVKTILMLVALSIPAIHAVAEEAKGATTVPFSGVINGIPEADFYTIMFVIALELCIIIFQVFLMKTLIRLISDKPELVPVVKAIVKRVTWWERFNSRVPVEKEVDILLDHNYDGIQELDNALPPWWKYGFYLTIVVAVIYLYRYQVAGSGPNPTQEYAAEVKQAEEDKAAYLATSASNIDENTVALLKTPDDLGAGQQIFQTTCAACHAKDGGGGVGPNLTDDYWLHGGGIKDVFKTIKYGWQDKGMKSWKDDFSPKQIAQIASYVKSLHGTKPLAPKDKQGEMYIEAIPVPKTDSAANKVVKN